MLNVISCVKVKIHRSFIFKWHRETLIVKIYIFCRHETSCPPQLTRDQLPTTADTRPAAHHSWHETSCPPQHTRDQLPTTAHTRPPAHHSSHETSCSPQLTRDQLPTTADTRPTACHSWHETCCPSRLIRDQLRPGGSFRHWTRYQVHTCV